MQNIDAELPKELLDELMQLIASQGKIVAIKHLREHSDYGLKDAKDIVDMLAQSGELYNKLEHSDEPNGNFELYEVQAPSEFKTLRLEHDTRQLFVHFQQGGKAQIDETHPKWDEIMQHFYNKTYPNVDAVFQDKNRHSHLFGKVFQDALNARAGDRISSHQQSSSIGFQSAQDLDNEPVRRQAGVEDLTKSSGKKWIIIAMLIVVIALLLIIFR
ncbi:Ribosomal protein L7/L12 C-terminal domain-containing protein [Acinetobacter marinus]|uniref:Ribosomal protein L7/L12 C-terminal domain-containing protein n=1 Tax=Acinetobacter marinus TaxID=281375 RepID=A0A1G6LF78_9GAMM|nr:hypothetical protein [Acinetobacter marinus]SDC41889.1 Ribosomal protein L7/L12 C-terminal domain-containing protein [Acinetobacter marinus]